MDKHLFKILAFTKGIDTDVLLKRVLTSFCVLIMSLVVIVFLIYGTQRNHRLDFDEANTLNIMEQSFSNISLILNKEQNIPGYYYLGHIILQLWNSPNSILLLNYIFWLSTIFLVGVLVYEYFKDKHKVLFYCAIYSMIVGVGFYSFYLRMYGLVVLLTLLLIYLFKKYLDVKKNIYLVCFVFVLLIYATIHPQFIFVWGIFFISFMVVSISTKERIFYTLLILPSFLLFLLFFLNKDLGSIYFGTSIAYVKYQTDVYFNFFSYLLFKSTSVNSTLIALLMYFVLIRFFVENYRNKIEIYYLLGVVLSFLLPISKTFADTSMHCIFLIPFCYIAFVRGVDVFLTKNKALPFLLLGIFIISFSYSSIHISKDYQYETLATCKVISGLGSGVYALRFHEFEKVRLCSNPHVEKKLLIFSENSVFDVSNSSNIEIMHIQAELGGAYYIPTDIGTDILKNYTKATYPDYPLYIIGNLDWMPLKNYYQVLYSENDDAHIVVERE